MLPVESELHLALKLVAPGMAVNDLAIWLFGARDEFVRLILARLLEEMQEQELERVLREESELVCRRCGVVHRGRGGVLRRGFRVRRVRTSCGEVRFRLRQVTCRECRGTWSPFVGRLGLRSRQRVVEELEHRLIDWVTQLGYAKTSRLGREWLGATLSARGLHRAVQRRGAEVELTREGCPKVVVADGTNVPAGEKRLGEEVQLAFEIRGRSREGGRGRVLKRLVGFGIGRGGWRDTLPSSLRPELIVTDAGTGLRKFMSDHHPGARHQLCEWHLGYTLAHFLMIDGVKLKQRQELARELMGVLASPEKRRARSRYAALAEGLKTHKKSATLLRGAAPYVLYDDPPSAERTTSIAEREMREINRRVDVGARWSILGVMNLLKLRLTQRINPDDYGRLWATPQHPTSWVVSVT